MCYEHAGELVIFLLLLLGVGCHVSSDPITHYSMSLDTVSYSYPTVPYPYLDESEPAPRNPLRR